MRDVEKAHSLLTENVTCALVKGDAVYLSEEAGIRPVMGHIGRGTDLSGFSVADRIVGRAAAMLFLYAGVTEVYAAVMSAPAAALLKEHGVPYTYGTMVENIINRRGDGICPMEQAVRDAATPAEALELLRAKVREMQQEKAQ